MHKKKGFSFLEVLIVILVVGVLFVTFRSSFQVKNKDILYTQACIESIYGQVNNFLHAAISSKSINSGGTQVFPNIYTIGFDPSNQEINLSYDYYIYSSILLSGQNTIQYCNLNNTRIIMTGDTYEIYINKGLQQDTQMRAFFLSGIAGPTGGNAFRGCDIQGTGCKEIARFITDTRTISIQKQMCLYFDDTGDCLERDN